MAETLQPATNRYVARFGSGPTLLPVVHVLSEAQALNSATVASRCGCRGVFLINHRVPVETLFAAWAAVRRELPDLWVGLNLLGERSRVLPRKLKLNAKNLGAGEVEGLWSDDGLINIERANQGEADDLFRVLGEMMPPPIYFGGVAFKYQAAVRDPARAAELARSRMDVVVTTGEATGSPAPIDKITSMKAALGDHPLGLASGVTASNASSYVAAGVSAFLVASSITTTDGSELLLEGQVRELLSALG